jgi:hypothetical protein
MNNYITLDGNKYATNAKGWKVINGKPGTERYTLLGALDVTYGPATPKCWEGEINGPVTARAAGWGTIVTLRTTLAKKQAVSYTDHYGTTVNVHCLGDFAERSLSTQWDGATNVIYVSVRLVKV